MGKPRRARVPGLDYAGSFLAVALITAVTFLVDRHIAHSNLSLVFLIGVLAVAAGLGLGPSLLAAVLSFLAYNFFFTAPFYTLAVENDADIATLAFFLIVAAVTGQLAGRLHDEVAHKKARLRRITILHAFAKRMAAAADTDTVVRELAAALSKLLDCPVAILLPESGNTLAIRAEAPPGSHLTLPLGKLDAAWRNDNSPTSGPGMQYLILGTARGPVGLAAVQGDELETEQREMAQALCDQAAIAIERTGLVADLEDQRVIAETEQLRSALLSSVSHDLRTPLASIIGSTSTLLEYGENIAEASRRDLLKTVLGEAERLNRYIQNLLDMTRLGQGGLDLRRDWTDLGDIVNTAIDRLRSVAGNLELRVELEPDLPLLFVHGVFIEQALVNVLDNALRFSPEDGTVTLSARREDGVVRVDICDQGPGIPEEERERIFDMFYSLSGGDRHAQGTGLGLAICRGLIGAHGGTIDAHPGEGGGGTCIRIMLPVQEAA